MYAKRLIESRPRSTTDNAQPDSQHRRTLNDNVFPRNDLTRLLVWPN